MLRDGLFRKSSYSSFEGNCVEVASLSAGVLVRNSREPLRILRFTDAEWEAFEKGVKDGEFD